MAPGPVGRFVHDSLSTIPAGIWKGQDVGSQSEWLMNQLQVPAADYTPLADQLTATNIAAVPPA